MRDSDTSVKELVDKIERQEIRLPELQRQYVWDKTRVRDLLDSLYRGFPSGTILTWQTDDTVENRGLATEEPKAEAGLFELLLDGQQRLTSLSAILSGKSVYVKNRKQPIDILFNLDHPDEPGDEVDLDFDDGNEDEEDNDLDETGDDSSEDEIIERANRRAFAVSSPKIKALKHWVSATDVFKGATDYDLLKPLNIKKTDDPRWQKYTDRLKVLRGIKDYKYRVTTLPRDYSYEKVTEIFVRVNSRGVHLRSSDLALAQVTAKWRGSLRVFEEFDKQCRNDHGLDLGVSVQLRNLVAFATGQSKFNTVHRLSKENLEMAWKEAMKGMESALDYLCEDIGINSMALLSSPFIVVALAKHLSRNKHNQSMAIVTPQLRRWVLAANAKARYSRGSSETLLNQDLATIKREEGADKLLEGLQQQVGRLEVAPEDLVGKSQKSALFKTMFLAFKENMAKDWGNGMSISLNYTGKRQRLQFHHIFPKSRLEKEGKPGNVVNDLCNLAFISGGTNRKYGAKMPMEYLPDVNDSELQKQCVPANRKLWELDRFEEFLSERRKLVAMQLNEYLNPEKLP